jgi:hypothetical protein
MKCRSSLISQLNDVLCYFGKLDILVKLQLMYVYCSSVYGSELWDLQNSDLELVCIPWRKALKRIWKVPMQSHSDILYCLCNRWSLEDELYRRNLLFIYRCLNSECTVVKYIASFASSHLPMYSPIGRNLVNGCMKYNIPVSYFQSKHNDVIEQLLVGSQFKKLCSSNCPVWLTNVLLEAIFVREGYFQCDNNDYSLPCITDIITYLCTS